MKNVFSKTIESMRLSQMQDWSLVRTNYEDLQSVQSRELTLGETSFSVQFNPKRIISSAAKVDAKSIQARKCFLCKENRPTEQIGIDFLGKYEILINPFPIFPKHLTIPSRKHQPQAIKEKIRDMLTLAKALSDYVIFYNGPKCGASAPDHFHFQAGNKGFLPIERDFDLLEEELISDNKCLICRLPTYPCEVLVLEADEKKPIEIAFEQVYNLLKTTDKEPMLNILAWHDNEKYKVCLFPRKQHRPSCYFAEGDKKILISPASVDMGGVFITPRKEDYKKLTPNDIQTILKEVCISKDAIQKLIIQLKETIE